MDVEQELESPPEVDGTPPVEIETPPEATAPAPDWRNLLPPQVLARLGTEPLDSTPDPADLKARIGEALDGLLAQRVSDERARWERDIQPALRKQVLAELNGSAATSPDLQPPASAPGTGPVAQEEWQRFGGDRAWRRANRQRIEAGLVAGLIRR